MSTTREKLAEASRRILENDPELANLIKNLNQDKELRKTVSKVAETISGKLGAGNLESPDADIALETIVQRVGRPVLLVKGSEVHIDDERLREPDADIWKKRLFPKEKLLSSIKTSIPAIGRVDLHNNASFEWVGTGWLIDRDVVITNRHVAEIFAKKRGAEFVYRRGDGGDMSARVDFIEEEGSDAVLEFTVKDILHIEPSGGPDIALLKIEEKNGKGVKIEDHAPPLKLATSLPKEKQFVTTIGYPAYDSRVPDQDLILKFFGQVFNKKRLAPGQIIGVNDGEIRHDCSTLGGNSGSPVQDLETGRVYGLHYSGRFLQSNYAVNSRVIADRLEKTNQTKVVFSKPELGSKEVKTPLKESGASEIVIPLQLHVSFPSNEGGITAAITARSPSDSGNYPVENTTTIKSDVAPPLTPRQFYELLDAQDTTEVDIAPYFIEDGSLAKGLSPGFRINEGMLLPEPSTDGLESALLLNGANGYCKMLRRRRYRRQIKGSGTKRIRVVAEGDSWFQYPFRLHDVIDHLMDTNDLAVYCCSEAGDVISKMLPKGEFLEPIQREEAKVFLFSGGGNDLVDGRGLRRFLHPLGNNADPEDYLNGNYKMFMEMIQTQYETLLTRVLAQQEGIHIILHGYSDAIPQPSEGKWLGKPMSEIGITDPDTQRGVINLILRDLNQLLSDVAIKFRPNATYVDLQGIVPAHGWHNEFHPTSEYFEKVTLPIYEEIVKHA